MPDRRGLLLSPDRARIARRRRREIRRRGRAKQFAEDRLQRVRPDLIALERGMQYVSFVEDAVDERSTRISQTIVDVEESDALAVGERREPLIDLVDRRDDRDVVVAWKDGGEDDRRRGCFLLTDVDDRLDPTRDLGDGLIVAGLRANIVGAGEQDNHLRIDIVQLTVLEPPEDVLRPVGTPAEVPCVPPEEVLFPVREQLGVVERTPSAND